MLKRANRLPSKVRLINASHIHSAHFLLKSESNALNFNRFGFIISKKTANRAVDRNRSKRLVRACVEEIINDFPLGKDYLFIIRKNLSYINKADLTIEVKKALH